MTIPGLTRYRTRRRHPHVHFAVDTTEIQRAGEVRPNILGTRIRAPHVSSICRSRFSTIVSPTCLALGPLPSIVVSPCDQVLSTHVRATYATRGPQYRDRDCATTRLLIFTRWRFAGRLLVQSDARMSERMREGATEPFESPEQKKDDASSCRTLTRDFVNPPEHTFTGSGIIIGYFALATHIGQVRKSPIL